MRQQRSKGIINVENIYHYLSFYQLSTCIYLSSFYIIIYIIIYQSYHHSISLSGAHGAVERPNFIAQGADDRLNFVAQGAVQHLISMRKEPLSVLISLRKEPLSI